MPLLKPDSYTIDDIYALPEGQRAELIRGQIYMMAPPNTIHQRISFAVSRVLADYIASENGLCEVFPAPFAVFLPGEEDAYLEPDISVICDKNKISDRGCEGAPDFVVEVVSPSSREMDYATKMTLYSDAGVREYWIIDPARERTTIYYFEQDAAPVIVPFHYPAKVNLYEDLEITIADFIN
ncbi:MAG: Uma2 family endonuclease [Clostridiales bacterium]|nr:Uma2 family endonuclease [Clostridiales bacterium]